MRISLRQAATAFTAALLTGVLAAACTTADPAPAPTTSPATSAPTSGALQPSTSSKTGPADPSRDIIFHDVSFRRVVQVAGIQFKKPFGLRIVWAGEEIPCSIGLTGTPELRTFSGDLSDDPFYCAAEGYLAFNMPSMNTEPWKSMPAIGVWYSVAFVTTTSSLDYVDNIYGQWCASAYIAAQMMGFDIRSEGAKLVEWLQKHGADGGVHAEYARAGMQLAVDGKPFGTCKSASKSVIPA